MKRLAVLLVKFYRKVLSPLKRQPTCRFTPTCSQYAVEALETRGFLVGTVLTVGRIIRCNPFCRGGYDPVPEKGLKRQNDPKPITKYYYPEEYHLERDDNDKT